MRFMNVILLTTSGFLLKLYAYTPPHIDKILRIRDKVPFYITLR